MKQLKAVFVAGLLVGQTAGLAGEYSTPVAPTVTNFNLQGVQKTLRFQPYPGAQAYTFLSSSNGLSGFAPDTNFFQAPWTNVQVIGSATITNISYEWRATNAPAVSQFYQVQITPLSSNALLAAQVLNRLAYGPTPDELERVTGIGADAYIAEQLNMGGIPDALDNYVTETTNSVATDATTNWTYVVLTGKYTSTNFYIFMTQPGAVLIDDVQLFEGTNAFGTNLLTNGDFESALTPPWRRPSNMSNSVVVASPAHSGNGALLVSAIAGATAATNSALWQPLINTLTNNSTVTLSYWYLPTNKSSKLTLGFSGSGLVSSAGDIPPTPTWTYCTASGKATATNSLLYVYPSGTGDFYLDDFKLVSGSVPEAGVNLLTNGDFETGQRAPWGYGTNYSNSVISATLAHGGSNSLHVVVTTGGVSATTNTALFQRVNLVTNQTYTLSYWYSTATPTRTLTAQLTGGLLTSKPDTDIGGLARRLSHASGVANPSALADSGTGIDDLRAWWCQRAVSSPRQLEEILSQFLENHFVTQYQKSYDYLNGFYGDGTILTRLAADWEWREQTKWRNAMLNPDCTFYDLLRISAESPAMIVYLDSVNSSGSGSSVANENYARELLELFTFGVDNGYDQNDIIAMSRAWTGWSVQLVDPENANNPFAAASVTYNPNIASQSKSNIIGVWAFNYKSGSHGTNRAPIFSVWDTTSTNLVPLGAKQVPARFGPPWAGRFYQLNIPGRATSTTNSIQDGYDVIAHLANQPFTEEYISIKLCRLFVHDDFPNPTTNPADTNDYAFYDYTDPNHSEEAELVHQCMLAWENSSPKGRLRDVLAVIFNSDLFRKHGGSMHKVKTPLEFVASTVRALRSTNPDGTATASTDGYSFKTPLNRMGSMDLFDRAEPNGYPETAPGWVSAGTLVERLRYAQSYCIVNGGANRSDAGNNICDPVALLKKKTSSGTWNNAGAVADYFLGIIFPGEGAGNLALYRQACIDYLNDGSADSPASTTTFATLGNTTTNYDTRVRGMVALLFTMQRFQEQ
ncbi:MAG: hypothetical protein RLY20_2419 [Verrucomicrobiota bacterium]